MRVLVADDQVAVRSALRLLLEQGLGGVVAGEAADARALADEVRELAPELVLLDWELPGLRSHGTPGSFLYALRRSRPGLAIIALSSRPEARNAALAAGADAFVSKGEPPEHLLAALRALGHPQRAGRA